MRDRFWLFTLLVLIGHISLAQDVTHPREMKLPESDYARPDPASFELTLENGLTAFVARADQVPLVTLSAFIRAGLVDDIMQGSAEALRENLRTNGPANLSPEEFNSALRMMTAEYTVDMHDEWLEISLNVPNEDLDEALSLFSDVLRAPQIDRTGVEAAAARIQSATDDLGAEAGPALYEGTLDAAVEYFYDVIYTDHPYGYEPTSNDYVKLDVDDVRLFYSTYFVPRNITLAIAGDIDVDDMNAAIEAQFSDWSAGERPEPVRMPAAKAKVATQHLYPVDKLQSWLVFGHDLPEVPDADQAALEVMNYILAGGHQWTRMTVETRYKYGYTNDASGFLEPKWFGPGGYNFRSYSRPEVMKALYDNMMGEIHRIRSDEVSEKELFVAKGALAEGYFQVRYLDGYATTRNFALERLRYRNHDRSASYVQRIRDVNAEDVLAAARKYLRPDEMQVVLVGEDETLID